MTAGLPPAEDTSTSPDWEELERLLAEARQLSQQPLEADTFYQRFLGLLLERLPALGGIIWEPTSAGGVEAICQQRPDTVGLPDERASQAFHYAVVREVMERKAVLSFAPHSTDQGLTNPARVWLLFCPVLDEQRPVRVVELSARGETTRTVIDGMLRVLEAVAELASDFERHEQARRWREEHGQSRKLAEFSLRAHRHLGLPALAAEIVNETRRLIGCDRVSLLVLRRRHLQAMAVSGVAHWDRRSPSIRCLEALGRVALHAGAVSYPHAEEWPAEVETAVQALVDETHARHVTVIPLAVSVAPEGEAGEPTEPRQVGVFVVENFTEPFSPATSLWLKAATPHVALAVDNALLCHRWLRFRWMTWLEGEASFRRRGLPRWGWAIALLVAATVGLAWPIDFSVPAPGELMPRRRQDVFAPAEGIVVRIAVDFGQSVQQGAELVELRSPALEARLTEVLGKLRTTEEALAAAQTLRLSSTQQRTESSSPRLGADEEELKASLTGLRQQYALLQEERQRLLVRSSLDGEIVTRDLAQRLQSRPVVPGNLLLRVADLDGPWELRLELPERFVPEVRAARERTSSEPPVEFLVAAAPTTSHLAKIAEWGQATQLDADNRPVLPLVASLPEPLAGVAPGATVRARIACGRRARAYVWFHGGWDAIRTWWF